MESVNRQLLTNSCSAIGSNGQTGCTQAMLRKWFEERQLAKDEAAGIPSALFRYLPRRLPAPAFALSGSLSSRRKGFDEPRQCFPQCGLFLLVGDAQTRSEEHPS